MDELPRKIIRQNEQPRSDESVEVVLTNIANSGMLICSRRRGLRTVQQVAKVQLNLTIHFFIPDLPLLGKVEPGVE